MKLSIAVSEFALPAPRRGSIDVLSGYGRTPQSGIEIHGRVQASRIREFPTYRAEVMTEQEFKHQGYTFEVGGRMDGLFDDEVPKIEEIKSSFNVYDLLRRLKEAGDDHPYVLQLKTYGYFYWLKNNKIPDLVFHLVSSRNGETLDYPIYLNLLDYELWLNRRLEELVIEAKHTEKRIKRRIKASEDFVFPFENPRSGQIELIKTIETGMSENRPMLIQAPTGLGKTVGVMFPTLKEALSRGQKLVYITPKNSQHSVAEDAVERLQDKGAKIKSLTLTAKSKMCMKNEALCNPEYCEFAKDHYTKVAEHKLIDALAKKKNLKSKTFKQMAEEFKVCPFELQLDVAHVVDTVICDYNYVFAPRSAFGRLSGGGFTQTGKPNLVIDEAHNLPARTMDYYSPTLSVFALEKMREDIRALPIQFQIEAQSLLDECISVIKACAPKNCKAACKIDAPAKEFLEQDQKLRAFLSNYLNSDVDIQPRDVVMRLSFYWSEFTNALEFVSGFRKEFFTTYNPNPAQIKITCCDASEMLKSCYEDYEQVVGFSATLKPFDFYSQLAGLSDKKLKTAEFVSPFPKEQRKLLLIPQISSKYSQRDQNYPKIADAINRIASVKRGNYFAFFPSFDFMEKVLNLFIAPTGTAILRQERYMRKDDIDEVMERLKDQESAHVIFAVQGGVFSEGVDYPGDMIIGAFVVGPPLPNFDLEREKMREYYEENYSAGFDYAYTYPAMAKAVQAAGRVIRSESDRGIIVLMDNRFAQDSYAKSMPQDWFVDSPQELVSSSILKEVSDFWQEDKS